MRTLSIVLLLALAACAQPRPTFLWARDGGTHRELARDNAVCTNEAYMIAGANPYVYAEQAYQNCMIGKGWQLKDVVYE